MDVLAIHLYLMTVIGRTLRVKRFMRDEERVEMRNYSNMRYEKYMRLKGSEFV